MFRIKDSIPVQTLTFGETTQKYRSNFIDRKIDLQKKKKGKLLQNQYNILCYAHSLKVLKYLLLE